MDTNLFRYIWRHSRSEQIAVLVLILGALPFYWASLDIPKRIVNDALQGRAFVDGRTEATLLELAFTLPDWLGGGEVRLFDGFSLDQLDYLMGLSFLFLAFVIVNGAFKYFINIRKGVLAERMLRRLRFDLFSRMMRFRPEDIRAVKPAEAASMIKDEVEPVGGFIGDAFIQPAFLGTQALTALAFIMTQSLWLGLVALSMVLVQAFIVPYLRREQLRLARERQLASRKLAGRIGEMIDGAAMIHTHGIARYAEADIGSRLGRLFDIRVALYKRKFAVKYLNNLLAQITPFFFYAIGGYFALKGSLDIGQLVAVIAAYRDLPPPIKELIDWDQQRADVTIKYQQVVSQFTATQLLPKDNAKAAKVTIPTDASIILDGLSVSDQRGQALIEPISARIARPAKIAIIGPSASGRDVLVRILGRQVTDYEGRVRLGDVDLASLSDTAASHHMAYVAPDSTLFTGTIRDNITVALMRHRPSADSDAARRLEAERSGNPITPFEADWLDYRAAGVTDRDALEGRIVSLLEAVGMRDELLAFGLLGRLSRSLDETALVGVVNARRALAAKLGEMARLVEPFALDRFNSNATIAENLVFGVVTSQRLAGSGLVEDPFFRAIVGAEGLERPLIDIGLRIAETTVEIFSGLPAGHPLLDRFSMIAPHELDDFGSIIELAGGRGGLARLSTEIQNRLMALALSYVEPRHRLGVVSAELEARILRARESFRQFLPQSYAAEIDLYNPDHVMLGATLRDNLLFGRVAYGIANAEEEVAQVVRNALPELGLETLVNRLALDYDVGPHGRNLFSAQRSAIALVRSLIRSPDILLLEGAYQSFGSGADTIRSAVCEIMRDGTVIETMEPGAQAAAYDVRIVFNGARARIETGGEARGEARGEGSTAQLVNVAAAPAS